MPVVSTVGRKSPKVRLLFLGMFLLLCVGALTMVYPFVLMLSMGTTGAADSSEFRLVPRYWTSDMALFRKYLADAASVDELAVWFGKDGWFAPRDVKAEDLAQITRIPSTQRKAMARDLKAFISSACPGEFKIPLFNQDKDSPLAMQTKYFTWLKTRYETIDKVNRLYIDNASTWEELGVPAEPKQRLPEDSLRMRDYREFIQSRHPAKTGLFNADAEVFNFVRGPLFQLGGTTIHGGLSQVTYDDIASGKYGEKAKRDFIASRAWMRFVQLNVAQAVSSWKAFLIARGESPAIKLSARIPQNPRTAGLWSQFVQSNCPVGAVKLLRSEDHWRRFLAERYRSVDALNKAYGTKYADFGDIRIPYASFHYDNFLAKKDELRKQYLLHNFRTVLSFVTVHGHALIVTVIFILLTIASTLTVNPLAAYAMSRFRLRESYHVLIFLLATMAFPGEVLMIPSFLMIKSFPLAQILTVAGCILAFALLQMKLKSRMPFLASASVAFIIILVLVGWVVPAAASALGIKTSVSLMNSFWALVLPGMANGYGIFLLKGFFDSLPPELYEAGLIDGASEMTMFTRITLPLCKPILAVLALGAFTSAYGAFMHAFLVCQNPKMWTLMVFLYEFQQTHSVSMAMAALAIAAVPTLLVFIFCQNIILRGIVIPTYK